MLSTKLPLHEWCIVLLFCTILLILAAFALGRQKSVPIVTIPSESPVTFLQVKVKGQVAKPGTYRLPLHSNLKELMEFAEPLPSADLSQLKWRRQLQDGQTIHVPEQHWITIQMTGAVQQPGPLKILSGTRCCELADQLQVLPEADLRPLRKKNRFLREGESLDIPLRKLKKSQSQNKEK